MALRITEQELKELGFILHDISEGSQYKIHARKSVGDGCAFFLYEESFDMYLWREGKIFRKFEIVTESDNGFTTVINDIDSLERFIELETVLNGSKIFSIKIAIDPIKGKIPPSIDDNIELIKKLSDSVDLPSECAKLIDENLEELKL